MFCQSKQTSMATDGTVFPAGTRGAPWFQGLNRYSFDITLAANQSGFLNI
jgi:hypothetical protein